MKQRSLFAIALVLGGMFAGWRGAITLRANDPRAIWRQSITVGADVPMRAELTMTRRRHGQTLTTRAHILQGPEGRYRMEYLLPADAKGRIVYSDGHTTWQYEPGRRLLAKTPLIPENEQNERQTEDLIERNYRLVLVSDQETAAGRPVYLLELLPRQADKSTQRRWIDRQTYKTLRVETHYPDGILARMVAYENVTLPAQVAATEFQPSPTGTLSFVNTGATSNIIPVHDLAACASGLGLKAEGALGFQLAQVASSSLETAPTAHLLYTDGIESVSVFVQNGGPPAQGDQRSWHRVNIEGQTAFENLDGHLDAVVWVRNGHRYTAVSHLGPRALQVFVGDQMRAAAP